MDGILNYEMIDVLGALAGGFLGATLGALVVFVFTGFALMVGIAILIGAGDPAFLNMIALGPLFGPHISFAAGIGAAAYASHKKWLSTGRDIVTPLVSLGKPSVLLVGAGFGLFGYIVQKALVGVDGSGIGNYTDSVALTVVISAIVARLLFSTSGIIGQHHEGKKGWARFETCEQHAWLAYQGSFPMAGSLGLFVGGISAWASVCLLKAYPEAPGVIFLGFAISAVSLLFLGMNVLVPATHHITLVSAVAVSLFMGKISSDISLIIFGAVIGMLTAFVAEIFSRFWLIRADTHIDPPASSIWPMTTMLIFLSMAIK